MGTTFIVQTEKRYSAIGRLILLPACDFGDTAIRMVDYHNWLHPSEKQYAFELFDYDAVKDEDNPFHNLMLFDTSSVPIGSVEFALAWFKAMGIDNVKPLNIPKELWHFCDRHITIDYCSEVNGHFMLKDTHTIKAGCNGEVYFNGDGGADKKYFLSEWLDDVVSEWRIFVFNGKIYDIRCYSGDFWATPDRQYIESIVKEYNNPSYTLDVMVTPKRTEILELHDFFSCGLYGFEDPILPLMWKRAIRNVMEREKVRCNGSNINETR